MIEAFDIINFDSVSSTQDKAREVMKGHGSSTTPIAVIAKSQTAGRGRYERQWSSPSGGLYMTMVINPKKSRDTWSQISYIVGVSMAEAMLQLDPSVNVRLKWVNDIMIKSKKAGGILLEADAEHLLIGVGMNIQHFDELDQYNGIALGDVASGITADRLASSFLKRFIYNYNIWAGSGFEPIRGLWLRMAQGVGKSVKVRFQNTDEEGTFIGLDENGHLQLLQDGNMKLINAGELFFGAAA